MESLKIFTGGTLGHREHVDRTVNACGVVNDRRCRDANLGSHFATVSIVRWYLSLLKEVSMPKCYTRSGAEGIHAVVLGRHEKHVVRAFAGHHHRGHI